MNVWVVLIKKIFTVFLVASFVSGCAPRANGIKAAYVSPLEYQNFDCEQIGQEMSRVGRKASEMSGQQDSTATKDAVVMGLGLVVFWPSLFFLAAGENNKEEISRLKGESEALQQCAINKGCTKVLAQVERERKLYEEAEKVKKVDTSLVDAKLEECNLIKNGHCDRDEIEEEIRLAQVKNKETEKVTGIPENQNQPRIANLPQPATPDLPIVAKSKEKSSLIEAKRRECIDQLGLSACNTTDFEAEGDKELAERMALSPTKVKGSSSEAFSPLKATAISTSVVEPKQISTASVVYRTKCTTCDNTVSYHAKYAGELTTCMQCDNQFKLP